MAQANTGPSRNFHHGRPTGSEQWALTVGRNACLPAIVAVSQIQQPLLDERVGFGREIPNFPGALLAKSSVMAMHFPSDTLSTNYAREFPCLRLACERGGLPEMPASMS
jgi:hypothetical protein